MVGAEKEFRAARLLKPMEDRYVRGLAVFYIQRARYEEAIEVIADHVKVCGATALGLELQGELLFHQKNYDVAFEMVRRSLDLFNNNARMHQLLALIYVTHGQNPLAVDELQIAAELEPNQPQIRYFYGRVLYDTGRYPEARDQFLAWPEDSAWLSESARKFGPLPRSVAGLSESHSSLSGGDCSRKNPGRAAAWGALCLLRSFAR